MKSPSEEITKKLHLSLLSRNGGLCLVTENFTCKEWKATLILVIKTISVSKASLLIEKFLAIAVGEGLQERKNLRKWWELCLLSTILRENRTALSLGWGYKTERF